MVSREDTISSAAICIPGNPNRSIRSAFNSSKHFKSFLGLKRKNATEAAGEMLGFTLVYSGNF
ncbi:glycoside hydrolase family 36 N-terminal domain-containing protein [Dubosiella newyorkensis]|uniref:glycoside hydrolase family 36 N-terminal domain-containing protein n=1 Tax=Dubosiella newyorkensis TaxID=1862672 RepID=UPI003F66B70F